MQITNISEAKAHLSALIEKVLAGEDIIIGKAGKPVARLIPYKHKQNRRKPGALKGKIKSSYRLPICEPSEHSVEILNELIKKYGI